MSLFTFTDKKNGLAKNMFKEATAFLEKEAVPFAHSSLKELTVYFLKVQPSACSFLGGESIKASEGALADLEKAINRLAQGEPPQYITGIAPFFGYDFCVDDRVLIPRFDTEILVEKALEYIREGDRVLDLCSGSGCIGIAAALNKNIRLTALDISRGAGEVFKANCQKLLSAKEFYIKNPPEFLLGDVFDDSLSLGEFDVVLSNPPYIREDEKATLTDDVLKEPFTALFGGKDGLDFYRRIVPLGRSLLRDGGYLLFECGKGQSEAIKNIMRENGYKDPVTVFDYSGIDRVVCGRK